MQPSLPELPPMKPVESASPPPPPFQAAAPVKAAPVGTRRLRQIVGYIASGGIALVLAVGVGEVVLRDDLRPTTLLSTVETRTDLGVMNQKLGVEPGVMKITEAQYQEAIAKAQRDGQAKAEISYQRDLAVVQADKERVVAAYSTLYQRANMIAQVALQLETLAQQMRAQLIQSTNGGRSMVIMFKDIFCGLGDPTACQSARADRGTMITEADELSRGDVGKRVNALMASVDDPASLVTHEDRRRNGTPKIRRH